MGGFALLTVGMRGFLAASLAALFIGGGLAIARMITDKTWAFAHHIDFNKKLGGTHHPR